MKFFRVSGVVHRRGPFDVIVQAGSTRVALNQALRSVGVSRLARVRAEVRPATAEESATEEARHAERRRRLDQQAAQIAALNLLAARIVSREYPTVADQVLINAAAHLSGRPVRVPSMGW